jgi:predicted amidohydrolase YtcJ
MDGVTIYEAARIVTLDPLRPSATHVAVAAGRILGTGDLEELSGWGPYELDRRFADRVLTPGFVEGHAHMMTGGIWAFTYVGHMDRHDPQGRAWPAARSTDAIVARLKEGAARDPGEAPVVGWGLDPLFLDGPRLSRRDLDLVSTTRPVVVMHSNFHLITTNSAGLALAGFDAGTNVRGVVMGEGGTPSGELQEFAAMMPLMRRARIAIDRMSEGDQAHRLYAEAARQVGVTTITDLGRTLSDADVEQLLAFTASPSCPIRLAPMIFAHGKETDALIADTLRYRRLGTAKLKLGAVKIVVDGSIQGFTARLKWPGYYRGVDHGLWNVPPDELDVLIDRLHGAGLHIHVHVNGDEASEAALDAFDKALARSPRRDHRHTLQHCQMADQAQYRRMRALGLCVNLFANHLYYFGDKHFETTLGPQRAGAMNACGTALREGVPLAIHSDSPVTPLAPLTTAWCAVNRLTESGRLLGAYERIGVEDALRAITLGPAYTLHMDGEVGSIEVGKRADFAILDQDPLEVAPSALRDIRVIGTILDGVPTQPMAHSKSAG